MKKTLAGLGVLALATLGLTGASFPANALEVQPVAEIVAAPDAIVASPDAVLTQSEPAVTTTAAEVPTVPVTLEVEPAVVPVAPVAPAETVEVPEPVQYFSEHTEVPAPVTPDVVVTVADTMVPVFVCPEGWWKYTGGICVDPVSTRDGETLVAFDENGAMLETVEKFWADVPDNELVVPVQIVSGVVVDNITE